jgi:tetratricopeptide (TPR) repeat protein
VRKELLSVRSDKLSPDRGQYMFAQTLLRTVAYEMLSKRERKLRHLAVAAHLRATFDNDAEDVAEVVAAHYRDALLAGEADPDATDIRREALTAYGRAGRRAVALGAPETAMRIYLTASELADEVDDRLLLLEKAADMALAAGRHQDTYDLYSGLRAEHAAVGRRYDWLRLAVGMARGQARLGRQEEALETLKEVLPELDDGTYSTALAQVSAQLGNSFVFVGRPAEAEPHTEKALIVAQAIGDPQILCQALVTRGLALILLDRFEEGLIHQLAAVTLSRRHGLSDQEENALVNLSDAAMTSDLAEALDYGEAALAIARQRGNRYTETVAGSNLLYALLYAGEWARAEQVVADLLEGGGADRPQVEFVGSRQTMLAAWRGDAAAASAGLAQLDAFRDSDVMDDICSLALAEALVASADGRLADVVHHAGEILSRMRVQIAVRNESVRAAWVEAMDALLRLGDIDGAVEMLGRITELPPGFVSPYLKAESARFAARIAAARGDDDHAAAGFADAERQLEALGYSYWLARCRLDHADWLAPHDPQTAGVLAAQAAAVFEQLAATKWAERAHALVPEAVSV